MLNNEPPLIEIESEKIAILGIQDSLFKVGIDRSKEKIIVDVILEELIESFDGYKLLLSHRQELFDMYVKYDIDVAFTERAHGGQARLPFIGGVLHRIKDSFLPTLQAFI